MYREHFGLRVNPFALSPSLEFLYDSSAFQQGLAQLRHGLENGDAVILLTGPIGAGKTMVLHSFLSGLDPRYRTAYITNTRVGPTELLKLVVASLGGEIRPGGDKSDALIAFQRQLDEASGQGRPVLIIIDEAQNLAPDVLEEIRLLSNLGPDGAQPVQVVLAGQPELEHILRRRELAQLRQRVGLHHRLSLLGPDELPEYLDHRMRVAGCERSAFLPEAVEKIYARSLGVPRVVNNLAGAALLAASVAGREAVAAADVLATNVDHAGAYEDVGDHAQRETDSPPETSASAARPAAGAAAEPARREASAQRAWAVVAILALVLLVMQSLGDLADGLQAVRRSFGPAAPAEQVQPAHPEDDGDAVAAADADTTQADASPKVAGAGGLADAAMAGQGQPQTAPARNPAKETAAKEPPATPARTVGQDPAKEKAASAEAAPAPARTAAASPESAAGQPQQPAAAAAGSGGAYYIHVSSFRDMDRALRQMKIFETGDRHALYIRRDVDGVSWYRIYLGPYPSRADASADGRQLQDQGLTDYFQITKEASLFQ